MPGATVVSRTARVIWAPGGGLRAFEGAQLPVGVAVGRDGTLNAFAFGSAPALAWIGVDQEMFFIHRGEAPSEVQVDGAPLGGARWLEGGETIELGGSVLHVRCAGNVLTLAGAGGADAGGPEETVVAAEPQAQPPQRHVGRWLAAVAILATVGAGAYMLRRPHVVEFDVVPEGSTILIDGRVFPADAARSALLSPGKHRIEASKPGFEPVTTEVDVNLFGSSPVRLALKAMPGVLTITTEPPGVEVTVDGLKLGPTPFGPVELPAGRHTVAFSAKDFLPAERSIDIEGLRKRQALHQELRRSWSHVVVQSDPPGATVLLDQRALGPTPLRLELFAGKYTLTLQLPERQSQVVPVEVQPDSDQTLPVMPLPWLSGIWDLKTDPEGAWLEVNGKVMGRAPVKLELEPHRELSLRVFAEDFREARLVDPAFSPGESRSREIKLEILAGTVEFDSKPARAEVRVDDRLVGLTPHTMQLPARTAQVEFRRPGYESAKRTIKPVPERPLRVEAELLPAQRATRDLTRQEMVEARARLERFPRAFDSKAIRYEMVLVIPGEFELGTPGGTPHAQANERPVRVELQRPFYCGVFPITNGQFRTFNSKHDSGIVSGYFLRTADHPVVNVTWEDAVRFCNWLNTLEGRPPAYRELSDGKFEAVQPWPHSYRLPTEAEWEYVARHDGAGPRNLWPWAGAFPPPAESGNFADESGRSILSRTIAGYKDGFAATSPVGRFAANPLGVHDLAGNVAEWCHDFYSALYAHASPPAIDPIGPAMGALRVVRGSSWRTSTPANLRAVFRRYADAAADDVGFRIVLPLPLE